MKLVAWILWVTVTLAALSAGVGFGLRASWVSLALAVGTGALWLLILRRRIEWAASLPLFGFTALAVLGIAVGVSPGWILVSLAAALAAWDLDYFLRRVQEVKDSSLAASMIAHHLRRLVGVMAVGLLAASGALLIQYRLTFSMAIIVSLLAVFVLTRLISMFTRSGG
jgi:hypothetical protein